MDLIKLRTYAQLKKRPFQGQPVLIVSKLNPDVTLDRVGILEWFNQREPGITGVIHSSTPYNNRTLYIVELDSDTHWNRAAFELDEMIPIPSPKEMGYKLVSLSQSGIRSYDQA